MHVSVVYFTIAFLAQTSAVMSEREPSRCPTFCIHYSLVFSYMQPRALRPVIYRYIACPLGGDYMKCHFTVAANPRTAFYGGVAPP
jgi:hypothetical protein